VNLVTILVLLALAYGVFVFASNQLNAFVKPRSRPLLIRRWRLGRAMAVSFLLIAAPLVTVMQTQNVQWAMWTLAVTIPLAALVLIHAAIRYRRSGAWSPVAEPDEG